MVTAATPGHARSERTGGGGAHAHGHAHDHDHDQDHDQDQDQDQDQDHRAHDHDALMRDAPARKLAIALGATSAFCVVEAVAGKVFGSLALFADAGHMLSDAGALLLALVAQRVARRTRTRQRTFGYRRAEILAAFVNGVALAVAAIWVLVEAVRRWSDPPAIEATGVLITAALGLVVNVVVAYVLAHGEGRNANTRAALAHVLADALGSVGAIVSALVVMTLHWRRADPLVSGFIALLLAYGAWHLISRTTCVLMEGSPAAVDLHALEATVLATPGVADAHDLHAWTISDGFDAVTVHVVLVEGFHGTDVASAVARRVREAFCVTHVTVQPEVGPPALLSVEALTRRREETLAPRAAPP